MTKFFLFIFLLLNAIQSIDLKNKLKKQDNSLIGNALPAKDDGYVEPQEQDDDSIYGKAHLPSPLMEISKIESDSESGEEEEEEKPKKTVQEILGVLPAEIETCLDCVPECTDPMSLLEFKKIILDCNCEQNENGLFVVKHDENQAEYDKNLCNCYCAEFQNISQVFATHQTCCDRCKLGEQAGNALQDLTPPERDLYDTEPFHEKLGLVPPSPENLPQNPTEFYNDGFGEWNELKPGSASDLFKNPHSNHILKFDKK